MNKEEIKEYLKRVEELEEKLEGEDSETLQWLIFGYNQCARLLNETEQENKQLKEVIEEVMKILNNQINYREYVDIINAIEEVLDKIKGELENE